MQIHRALALAAAAGLAAPAATAQTDIFWDAGSGVWSAPGNWNPVNVPDTTAENARIGGVIDRQVFYNINGSLNILELGQGTSIFVEPGSNLAMVGDLINDSFISVNASDSPSNATIRFDANVTISGNGILRLSGGGDDAQLNTNGTVATFGPGQTVRGIGRMNGTFTVQGRLEPGLSVGTITATGANMTFAPSAVFAVEASSDSAADLLNCGTRAVNLGGTLTLEGIEGYVPTLFDEWPVISAGQVNGEFDSVQIVNQGLPAGIRAVAVYSQNAVVVRVVCTADLNGDGILDLSDITFFTQGFLAQDPATDLAAPFGVWDLSDINTFVSSFLGTCN